MSIWLSSTSVRPDTCTGAMATSTSRGPCRPDDAGLVSGFAPAATDRHNSRIRSGVVCQGKIGDRAAAELLDRIADDRRPPTSLQSMIRVVSGSSKIVPLGDLSNNERNRCSLSASCRAAACRSAAAATSARATMSVSGSPVISGPDGSIRSSCAASRRNCSIGRMMPRRDQRQQKAAISAAAPTPATRMMAARIGAKTTPPARQRHGPTERCDMAYRRRRPGRLPAWAPARRFRGSPGRRPTGRDDRRPDKAAALGEARHDHARGIDHRQDRFAAACAGGRSGPQNGRRQSDE